MSVEVLRSRADSSVARGNPRWVIAGHVARGTMRMAVIWGVVFGVFVLATIKAFVIGYPTLSDRMELANSLQSFAMLLGTPRHAETVAGFTMWRLLVAITIIGSIWGLLTSTGLMRGEEEAGRWEILMAGQTTKGWAAAQALLGLAGALVAMFLVTALLTVTAGRMPGARFPMERSLLFALAMVSGPAMFLAIGALASQMSATRGQAITIGTAILGASYLLRMVADSRSSLGWMRWLSPIGWVQELRPLRDPQPWALIPIVALVLICAGLTVLLAGRRDLNASFLREGEGRTGDGRWLLGPVSLVLRLSIRTALAWLAGLAAMGVIYGYLARSFASILASSPAITSMLGRLGVKRASEGFLGIAFFIFAIFIAIMAASQIASIREEEASGRLDNLLVRPVRRITWLAGRIGVSLSLVLLAGAAAGLSTWIGAASQHTGVSLPKLLEAGLNAAVPGIFVLGVGILVIGLRPRLGGAVAYTIVAWSFLADMLGAVVKGNSWLRDSSLFAHIELAPAAKPDWGTAAIIVLIGTGAAVAGAVAFQRRDIQYT